MRHFRQARPKRLIALLREFRARRCMHRRLSWSDPVDGRHMAWEVALPEGTCFFTAPAAMLREDRETGE